MKVAALSSHLSNRWLIRSQFVLCSILFGLIILGAGVRLANAGLACPDWPLCYGEAIPTFNFEIFMEWIHRVIAMTAGILAVLNSVMILSMPSTREAAGRLVLLSLFLFAIQAFLGKKKVTDLLDPQVVNAHLLGGYLLIAVQLWILHRLREADFEGEGLSITTAAAPSPLRFILGFFSVFALLQATMGGTVSSHYAGLVCPDFPTCNGEWFPALTGLVAVKVLHRWAAFALLFGTLILTVSLSASGRHSLKTNLSWIIFIIVVQICLGVAMVFTQLQNPFLSLLHSAGALSIFVLFFTTFLNLSSHRHQTLKRSQQGGQSLSLME